jgi:hypothetical protein
MNHALTGRLLAGLATIIVASAVTVAIVQNPPGQQRLRKLDDRRVHDVQRLNNAINAYWRSNKALPSDLAAMEKKYDVDYTDPETKVPYVYEKTGQRNYRLCAVFAMSSDGAQNPRHHFSAINWRHGQGRHCFDLTPQNSGDSGP